MRSEREERLFGHIRTRLDEYERDEAGLRALIGGVEAAIAALLEESEEPWLEELRTAWSGLEMVYAGLVDEDRSELNDEDRADIRKSITEIRALLAAHPSA